MNKPVLATKEDKEELKNLWKTCFMDSDSFINWFFDNRFVSNYSVCIKENNKIVNAMHSYPLHIKIRDTIIPCAILCGFSTHPQYRGRGYMKYAFKFLMEHLNNSGVVLAPHTPDTLESYYKFGNYPATNTTYLSFETSPNINFPEGIIKIDLNNDMTSLFGCYRKFSEEYSGIISRSMSDFRLKCGDYSSDGAECIAYINDNIVRSYCIYYKKEKFVHGEEIIFLDDYSKDIIINAIISISTGLRLSLKLPPNSNINIPNLNAQTEPQGVMGVVNVSYLLKYLGNDLNYKILVTDPILKSNNNIFRMSGKITDSFPDIEISAGNLIQFLEGYKSLHELELSNEAKINNKNCKEELDKIYPKQNCFIIDEY